MGLAMQNMPNANPGVAAGPMRSGWMGAMQRYGGQAISNAPQGQMQPQQSAGPTQVTTNPMTRNVQPIPGRSYAPFLRKSSV